MDDSRRPCKYWEKCYQKNPDHHERFRHPVNLLKQPEGSQAEKANGENEAEPPRKKKKLNENDSNINKDNGNDTDDRKVNEKDTDDRKDNENCTDLQKDPEHPTDIRKDNENDDKIGIDHEDIKIKSLEDEVNNEESPISVEESISSKFLVQMPKDFYDFWEFCKSIRTEKPEDSLKEFGLQLVGPFEVLSGKLRGLKHTNQDDFLCHWRFYYDPPEFQTVLVGDNEYHIGYFRDDPSEDPVFLAALSSQTKGVVQPLKEDIFSTVCDFIESKLCNKAKGDRKKQHMLNSIQTFATGKKYSLDGKVSDRLKQRRKKVVAKSFHGAGIVVPVDKTTDVGYREIPETNSDLKKMFKKIIEAPTKEKKDQGLEALQELITNAQWATDEGDFGMGLELGLDLFAYGGEEFHPFILHLLTVAYDLLNREPFSKIMQAHLRNRRKGSNMAAFDYRHSYK